MCDEQKQLRYEGEELSSYEGECDYCNSKIIITTFWTFENDPKGHSYWDAYCEVCDETWGDVIDEEQQ